MFAYTLKISNKQEIEKMTHQNMKWIFKLQYQHTNSLHWHFASTMAPITKKGPAGFLLFLKQKGKKIPAIWFAAFKNFNGRGFCYPVSEENTCLLTHRNTGEAVEERSTLVHYCIFHFLTNGGRCLQRAYLIGLKKKHENTQISGTKTAKYRLQSFHFVVRKQKRCGLPIGI